MSVASSLIFGDVIIETTGSSQPIGCHGHLRGDAEEPAIELMLDFFPHALRTRPPSCIQSLFNVSRFVGLLSTPPGRL